MKAAMLTANWQQVESIFHAALPHRGDRRRRILERDCGDDSALRAEVESLLDAVDTRTTFDEGAAARLAADLVDSAVAPPLRLPEPSQIGPYRLLRVLGEGGMGTVHLAEQQEPLPRRVAIKLPRSDTDAGPTARHRFELERQALARMSHPAIAQVFDAGTTDAGRPFVVLEYVDGEPITAFCDARRVSLRERVELFVAVCEGVAHAHAKAVIHCDLKPSNLLVGEADDGSPRPKIIDFGIAKALEPWSDPTARLARAARGRAGSLRYMSPEALLGGNDAVDTRSDVYSLGIVLCELMTGVRPERAAARPSRLLRAEPLSTRRELAERRGLPAKTLEHRLRTELDWIVARATALDADERYGSVRELADDLRRWLDARPVAARPPSVVYRAGKFLRRHAALATVGALLALFVVGFAIGATVLYARAEAARQQAEGLVRFMLDDLGEQLEPIGRLELLESVSRRSLAYFEERGDERGEPLGEIGRDDAGPGAALRQIARVLASRGDFDAALDAATRAWRLDQARHRRHGDEPAILFDLGRDLRLLGDLHGERGETDLAIERFAAGEATLRRVIADRRAPPRARRALAETLVGRGALLRLVGDVDEVGRLLHEAEQLATELLGETPDDPETRAVLGEAHYAYGLFALYSLGDSEAAVRAFASGTDAYRRLVQGRPEAVAWRYRLAVLLGHGLATAHREADRLPEAWRANGEALEILDLLASSDPENSRYAHALGWELVRRGDLAWSRGDLDAAARAFERSTEVQAALVARTALPTTAWLDGLATAHEALAEIQAQRGELTAAIDAAHAAIDIRRRITGTDASHPFYRVQLVAVEIFLGELRHRSGDLEGARRVLDSAAETLRAIAPESIEEPFVQENYAHTVEHLDALREILAPAAAPESLPSPSVIR